MKSLLKAILLLLISFSVTETYSQTGGTKAFTFLNLPNSARVAALGYNFVAIDEADLSIGLNNPSLITSEMHNDISLNFVDNYADINYGFVSYSRTFEKIGSFAATVQYIDYGKFVRRDETGQETGEFSGNEFAPVIGWGRRLDSSFSIGANLKAVYSTFETFNSFGLAVDVAGSYHVMERGFVMSLIARNIGTQLTQFTPGKTEPMPLEIQFGLSKKLEHMPFRYSILLTNLQKWDLTYTDPADDNIDPFTGEVEKKSDAAKIADQALRHIVIGGELIPSKNFSVRVGYNYQRRQEMKLESKKATVGFSWGFGFRVSRFNISYARSAYHISGSPNIFSLGISL
ncbi:MAG TPA: type IX secretion system protein PorQ [Lentimicrobium sp.]|nr:type IX secretion system protein PorQ [Lentimicrobium sp.]